MLLKELKDTFKLTLSVHFAQSRRHRTLSTTSWSLYPRASIVEMASRDELFFTMPAHPYTQALIDAIPRIGKGKKTKR